MKTAKLYLEKTVDTWGPDGAGGTCRIIFDASQTVEAPELTGPKGLNKPIAAFIDSHGLDFDEFEVFEEDSAGLGLRFTFCRVENGNGDADEDGTYLADYNLYVETRETTEIQTPDFGKERV